MVILKRSVTQFQDSSGNWYARAHVWTEKGYSSKTFNTVDEAKSWRPKS